MASEEKKHQHSTATVVGFGHTTIRGKFDLLITVSGGRDLLHHALIVKAIQDANETLMEYGAEVKRTTLETIAAAGDGEGRRMKLYATISATNPKDGEYRYRILLKAKPSHAPYLGSFEEAIWRGPYKSRPAAQRAAQRLCRKLGWTVLQS